MGEFKLRAKIQEELLPDLMDSLCVGEIFDVSSEPREDYVFTEIWGECDDIASLAPEDGENLQSLSERLDAEVEVFAMEEETGNMGHLHYNRGKVIKESLPLIIFEEDVEEGTDIDLTKYNYFEEQESYVLKPELAQEYDVEESNHGPVFQFEMV